VSKPQSQDAYRSLWTHLSRVPFTQGWVTAGGLNTRYARAGRSDAPTIVMLHGTGGHWEAFAPTFASHAPHFQCLALDMIGCGFSDKPDYDYEIGTYANHVLGFMDALGVARASLIGVSLGSWVAARLALDQPQRIERLALLSPAGYFSTPTNMARIRTGRSKAVEDPSWENIKAMFDHLLHEERSRIPDLIALRQSVYRLPDMERTMRHILALQEPEIRARNVLSEEQWKRITAPALVIGSLADQDEYLETARRVSKLMPNARYADMANVGHWPQWEDPEGFARLSIPFFLGK
jgi:2-hydroxy-6-oxonona-2,4-dienedioate hydrolase